MEDTGVWFGTEEIRIYNITYSPQYRSQWDTYTITPSSIAHTRVSYILWSTTFIKTLIHTWQGIHTKIFFWWQGNNTSHSMQACVYANDIQTSASGQPTSWLEQKENNLLADRLTHGNLFPTFKCNFLHYNPFSKKERKFLRQRYHAPLCGPLAFRHRSRSNSLILTMFGPNDMLVKDSVTPLILTFLSQQ
jgi:hypothetical protein